MQYTLDMENIIDVAIKNIKEYEPEEGYYVAFSGGKDSIVILDLIRKSGVKHDVNFAMTTVDPPEIYAFVKAHYPDINWMKPKKSMFQIIAKRKMPPTRLTRYCCSELKEIGGKNRVVVTGIRKQESASRRERLLYEKSTVDKTKWFLNPIIEWETSDVWCYIHMNKLPYPSLYDNGYDRVGCIMCPLQGRKGMLKDKERFPRFYKAYIRAFDKMLTNYDPCDPPKWKCGEDVMKWWIENS